MTAVNQTYAYLEVHFVSRDTCTMYRRAVRLNQRRNAAITDLLNEDDYGDELALSERPLGALCGDPHQPSNAALNEV